MMELLERLARRLFILISGSTLLQLTLLVLALISVETGLGMVVEHIQKDWLPATVLFAVLLGWILGRSRSPGWVGTLTVLGSGLVWILLTIGELSGPLDKLIASLPPVLKMSILHLPVDPEPVQASGALFMQTLTGLGSRLSLWFHNAGAGMLIIDPGITSLVWGLALWLVSAWAAWWLRRYESVMVGLLPSAVLLVYNIYYTNSENGIFWIVCLGGCWIMLQALGSYIKARRRWQERHMDQAEVEPLLAVVMTLTAAALMLTGGVVPSVSFQKLSENIRDLFRNDQNQNLAESLGLRQTPDVIPLEGVASIGLSETHAIGPGPQLSQEVMLYVTVDGYQPPPPDEVLLHTGLPQPAPQYYWRSQTFDSYNGHVWIANRALSQSLLADAEFHPELKNPPANFRLVRQHVVRVQPMDRALLVSGELLTVDQPSIADWRATADLVDARTSADSYTADSLVQSVTVAELRSAGNKYPESIQSYLNLPDNIPGRVRNLAVQLTIDQPTPYDKVMAIQNYLRQFPYSLQVPGTPADRETADYFLFDLQKGYCDYFATTMAVMVRAVGIPSRLVVGFNGGSYDYDSQRIVIVRANSHAWVEVYFPGFGWVEFEPTSNLVPFSRPGEKTDQNKPAVGIPNRVTQPNSGFGSFNWRILRIPLIVLEIILASLVVLFILWRLLPVESWLLEMFPAQKAITLIQQRLYRQGRNWGVPPDAARTPHEFAGAFQLKLERYSRNQRLAPVVTELNSHVNWLTGLYTRLLFSVHPLAPDDHHLAVRKWALIRKGLNRIRYS